MISFLNSGILMALAAVAIPLLIHLINRRKPVRIKFSTLKFLRSIEEKRVKKIKLYQILLILVRTLLLLFLVLAFARPMIRDTVPVEQASAHHTVVIILDNGINMRGYDRAGNRFGRAKDKIRLIRSQYGESDRILVLPSGDPGNPLTDSIAIQALPCSFTSADWRSAIETARRFFIAHPNLHQELFILSDFQFHDPAFAGAVRQAEPARIHLVQIRDGISFNVTIDTVIIRNMIFESAKPVQLDAVVRHASGIRSEDMELHLFVNGQRAAYQKIRLDPGEERMIPLSFLLRGPQRLEGYVEISDDDLLADNRYYFAVPVPESIKILYVEDEISPLLETALAILDQNTHLEITREKFVSWARHRLEDFQILFFSNPSILPPLLIQRLESYLDQGGCLFLMPGDKMEIPALNETVRKLNINFQVISRREAARREEFFTLSRENWNLPLFRDIFRTTAGELSEPRFYKYFQVQAGSSCEEIMAFTTTEPFILRCLRPSGSVYLFTSRIDETWNDLPYKGIFIPLLMRTLLLGSAHATRISPAMDIRARIPLYLKPPGTFRDIFIQSPDGNKTKIITQSRDGGIMVDLQPVSAPGIYTLWADAQELLAVPFNADTRILRPPYIDLDQGTDASARLRLVEETDDLVRIIRGQRGGAELGKFFFWLAGVALLIEIGLVKKIEGRKINRTGR